MKTEVWLIVKLEKTLSFKTKLLEIAIVTRGAKDSKDLMKNLSQYDEKKDKRSIAKQMIKAGAIALGGVALSNLKYPSDAAGMTMGEYIKDLRRINRWKREAIKKPVTRRSYEKHHG